MAERLRCKAGVQTQRVEHELEGQVGARHLDALGHEAPQRSVLQVGGRLPEAHLAHDAVRKRQLAVRARPDAQVVAELPVIHVVAAGLTGARVRGDLVVVETGLRHARLDPLMNGGRRIIVGQRRRKLGEDGVGLQRQLVERQVRRRQRQRHFNVGLRLRERLTGQRVHQVEVEGRVVALRDLHGSKCLRSVMHAAERLQVTIVERLHADRQPRDAGIAIGCKAARLEAAGIGLQRDLAIRRQRQQRTHVGQQPFKALGAHQTGRAAADEDGFDPPSPHQRQ